MANHFHLAIETPEGNLVAGMQWLQSTFANRFNRFRDVRGHLFQGRYKCLLVEPGEALGRVCHYLHLNPARAGVVSLEQWKSYRYSSGWYLCHPSRRRPSMPSPTRVAPPLSNSPYTQIWGYCSSITFLQVWNGVVWSLSPQRFQGVF